MTRNQVIEAMIIARAKMDAAQAEVKRARVEFEIIQAQCPHEKQRTSSGWPGETDIQCEDCGKWLKH